LNSGTHWWYQPAWQELKLPSKYSAFFDCASSRSGRAISVQNRAAKHSRLRARYGDERAQQQAIPRRQTLAPQIDRSNIVAFILPSSTIIPHDSAPRDVIP
jgi:hypothetical protein